MFSDTATGDDIPANSIFWSDNVRKDNLTMRSRDHVNRYTGVEFGSILSISLYIQ